MTRRAIAYIDGFNFYYGAVKDEPQHKWLNFQAMCEALLRGDDLVAVRYYTARVASRPGDPGPSQRQDVYLRALATLPKLDIVYGQFKERRVRLPLAKCPPGRDRLAEVIKTEEKGSDVNLATDLLCDGLTSAMDVALVVFERPRPATADRTSDDPWHQGRDGEPASSPGAEAEPRE